MKSNFPDKWKYLTKKLAYPYEYFNSADDYQKSVDNLKKEDCFSKLKNDYTGINLQTLQYKDMILFSENNIRGGISSVTGDRCVKTDENKKIMYIVAINLHGHSMSQPLPYDEIKFDKNVNLENILNSPIDSDIGYFVEVDLRYPDNKKKQRIFHSLLKTKK